jgi:hypothetical protein
MLAVKTARPAAAVAEREPRSEPIEPGSTITSALAQSQRQPQPLSLITIVRGGGWRPVALAAIGRVSLRCMPPWSRLGARGTTREASHER